MITSPKGIKDILPQEEAYWDFVENAVKKTSKAYGFGRIRLPIIEKTKLFIKGTGKNTEIVKKEMYSFKTKGGDDLTLRPEGTPGVMRAYLERGMRSLIQPVKLYYFEPMFRHERPQHGRQRQFYQIGFETIGSDSSIIDAEIIQTVYNFLINLGIDNFVFQINSIGDINCRSKYKKVLQDCLSKNKSVLCDNCQKDLQDRIFNIFECKEEHCQQIVRISPKIIDNLCDLCRIHFKELLEILDEIEMPYSLNHSIVRGLDYYTRTVFEVLTVDEFGQMSSQLSLAGGGRYDSLSESIGGPKISGSGVAIGVERIISVLEDKNIDVSSGNKNPDIFIAQLGFTAKKYGLKLFDILVESGINVEATFSKDSLSPQLKLADSKGARYTIIIGEKELKDKNVLFRDMKSGNQEILQIKNLIPELKNRLNV